MSLKDAIREAVDERGKQEASRTDASDPVGPPSGADQELPAAPSPDQIKQQSNKAANTASSETVEATSDEETADEVAQVEFAALTIRVPRPSRIHWLVSAKQQNTSLTAAITEALNARFGEPGR